MIADRNLVGFAFAASLALTGSQAFAGSGSGAFKGASGHVASGAVELVQTAEGWEVRLGDDFSFDGAPDARVGFGNNGAFAAGTDFEQLRSNTGGQVYKVPASVDPAAFEEVYIWCRQYSVPLGVAKVEK